ncbi:MAPEG family protein [uncultured Maricaulis sp.]|mgnify:FL=1|uniref:MAPEG family protein n=1 Tax=uncultured Maricaulis sp. TaxID=174710 RepID=UPI0030D7F2B5|tara:strand:- start:80009 stop:80401 length:393 start_codon:yes stop_codon:yes gene_type:complete
MTAMQAVALYAGLNILLLLFLAANVSLNRRRTKISLGTGNDAALEQACRTHGNAAESLPPALIALLLLGLLGTGTLIIHILGIALTLGRSLHAYGLLTDPGRSMGRVTGTALTWLVLLASSLLLLSKAIS